MWVINLVYGSVLLQPHNFGAALELEKNFEKIVRDFLAFPWPERNLDKIFCYIKFKDLIKYCWFIAKYFKEGYFKEGPTDELCCTVVSMIFDQFIQPLISVSV